MRQDPVRDEAERLVAAAIAAVSMAARTIPSAGPRAFANGSDECCVCPVCRVIASMRDPSAEMAERLATGAGELATAVAGVLRLLSRGAPPHAHDDARTAAFDADVDVDVQDDPTREGDEFWESMRRRAADAARAAAQGVRPPVADDPWRQATTAPATRPMAKKAVAKKVMARKAVAEQAPAATKAAAPAVAKKAVAKKAVAKKAVAKKAVAKKAVAKKAAKKAAPPPGREPTGEGTD